VEGGTSKVVNDSVSANGIACFEWPEGVKPIASITCRVATRDYTVNVGPATLSQKPTAMTSSITHFLQPSKLICTDGIVLETATKITRGATTDVEKARAIYEWIVENTFRDPKVRGCGVGDIRSMLETGNLGGKCADLNALYVGLARASGLPARHVYGLRVAKSVRGFKSLGPATDDVTKGQHCRVEVYLTDHGWVPVDPADVRKVALEEPPGNLPLESEAVRKARAMFFGAWEMNWIGYNFAHDVALPGSAHAPLGYLMYPQAETANGRLDSFDPDHFTYHITAHEVS
jgi:transglutaminase-like putative cysteine protease